MKLFFAVCFVLRTVCANDSLLLHLTQDKQFILWDVVIWGTKPSSLLIEMVDVASGGMGMIKDL